MSLNVSETYKSRKTILELLQSQGYDSSDYEGFSMNEVDSMIKTDQLDMLLKNEERGTSAYVKYMKSSLKPQSLKTIVDDLFVQEPKSLTLRDTLVIVSVGEPNDSIKTEIKYQFDKDGIFIVLHNILRLQFNILNHTYIPKVKILNEVETKELQKRFNVSELSQLPDISRFDPLALAICLRPNQVCLCCRKSQTALTNDYYRICV